MPELRSNRANQFGHVFPPITTHNWYEPVHCGFLSIKYILLYPFRYRINFCWVTLVSRQV